jgi:hypothetical protein
MVRQARPDSVAIGRRYERPRLTTVDWGYGTLRALHVTGRHPIVVRIERKGADPLLGRLQGAGTRALVVRQEGGDVVRLDARYGEILAFTVLSVGPRAQ